MSVVGKGKHGWEGMTCITIEYPYVANTCHCKQLVGVPGNGYIFNIVFWICTMSAVAVAVIDLFSRSFQHDPCLCDVMREVARVSINQAACY